jgi:trimethyllysine dioxygenase
MCCNFTHIYIDYASPPTYWLVQSVRVKDFLSEGGVGLHTSLTMLRDYGFFRIEGVEPTVEATQECCEKIAFLRETLYGAGMWKTEILADGGNDTAYTVLPLNGHTDGNYMADTPGIQTFHCLQADPSGGHSLLVDGFAVADKLKREQPDTFDFFTRLDLPFHHTDPTSQLIQWKRVFTLDHNGEFLAMNFNNDDRAVLSLIPQGVRASPLLLNGGTPKAHASESDAPTCIPSFYKHLRVLQTALTDPEVEVWMALRPGSMLVFDNTRVLHGRSGFSITSGRVLSGCYISQEEWHSKLRCLAMKLGKYKPAQMLQ